MAWRFKASKYKNAAPIVPKFEQHIRDLVSGKELFSKDFFLVSSKLSTISNPDLFWRQADKHVTCFHLHLDFRVKCRLRRVTLLAELVGGRGFAQLDEARKKEIIASCSDM